MTRVSPDRYFCPFSPLFFCSQHRRCWGMNDVGQLGIGNNNNVGIQPQPVSFQVREEIKVMIGT
jgi:hypothetical protein